MVVSFRQIRLFEVVGRLGSISRAAEDCGLSQPAATQSLAAFQKKVGHTLVEGGARGTALTPAGEALHARLALILRKLERGLTQTGVADLQPVIWRLSPVQLRLLDMIHEHGSLENAAVAMALARRSVHRSARALELLVGRELFVAQADTIVLTEAGASLARQTGLLASEIDWTLARLSSDAERAARTVVVGVASDPGTAALTGIIRAHAVRHPNSCIELVETGQNDLLARLAIGEIDLVIGHIIDRHSEHVVWQQLATASYWIVGRRGHPLTRKRSVTTDDLVRQTWVLGARGSQRRAASDILFADSLQPTCSLITSAAPLMAQLLADSDQLGLMTDHELASRRETLIALGHQPPAAFASIGWARRRDWSPTAAHLDMIELISARFASTGDTVEGESGPASTVGRVADAGGVQENEAPRR